MFILGVLVALGVLVIVHEAGHFCVARFFSVEVEKFSIGFGPKLVGFKRGNTEYKISLIPLGGYVKMKGDEPEKGAVLSQNDFYGIVWWKRALIVLAGPIANLILGFFLFTFSFSVGRVIQDHYPVVGKVSHNFENIILMGDKIVEVNGKEIDRWNLLFEATNSSDIDVVKIDRGGELLTLTTYDIEPESWAGDILPFVKAEVGEVAPGMPAYRAGLKPGDVILAVDSIDVDNWFEMRERIANNPENLVELTIDRAGEQFLIPVSLEEGLMDSQGQKMIGITQKLPINHYETFTFGESVRYGLLSTVGFITLNYQALFKMVSKPLAAKEHLGGPVMIIAMSQQTSQMGWGAVLAFVASISLILMIMNLLPIPVLDGGHILFFLIEGLIGRPLSYKVQAVVQQIGFALLMILVIFVFYNDFAKIVTRRISLKHHQSIELVD